LLRVFANCKFLAGTTKKFMNCWTTSGVASANGRVPRLQRATLVELPEGSWECMWAVSENSEGPWETGYQSLGRY
jgi:hypothetical protein